MTKKFHRWHRIFGLFLLIGIMVYFVAILWLLPRWLKAPINNRLIEQNLQIDYQKLWINPFTLNIQMSDLTVQDLSQTEILKAQQAHIGWHLLPLLQQQLDIQSIRLEQAQLNIAFNPQNQLISPQLPQTSDEPSAWHINFGQLEIINSNVTLQRQQQKFQITDIDVKINLSDIVSNEAMRISLKIQDQGEVVIHKDPTITHAFRWQLSNFSLAGLAMWLPENMSEAKINGQLNATGLFEWPENQQPIIQLWDTTVDINTLQWPPYIIEQASFKSENITVDFNNTRIDLPLINSTQGQLMASIDPMDLMDYLPESEPSDSDWTWHLQHLLVTDWHLSLADKKPAVTAQLQKLSIQSSDNQQIIMLKSHLLSPFEKQVSISANGLLNPLRLKGGIVATEVDLSRLNPWLAELSPWQIQQAALTVNSDYCFQQGVLSAQGLWQVPDLVAIDNNQELNAQQLNIQSISIDGIQQILSLNDINGKQIEVRQIDADTPIKPDDAISQPPPAQADDLWRVVIDQNKSAVCDF